MTKKIIRPVKGMDRDSAENRRSDDTIYSAKNLRFNGGESGTLGEYTNIKGINKVIQCNDGYIVGITKLPDYYVFIISGEANLDYISIVRESDVPKNGEGVLTLDNSNYYWNSTQGSEYHKVFQGDLDLASGDISVKSYYESSLIQKVYWTTITSDPLRSINVIKSTNNDPSTYVVSDLDIIPSVDLSRPEFEYMTSGNLTTGKIYYAYKLANNNGAETNLSELSVGVHLTESSENNSTDYDYKGSGFDIDSTKGVSVKISDIPSSFTKAKVYSIHYLNDVSIPVIKLIYDSSASGDLLVVDTGIALQELTAEEFATSNNLLINKGLLEIQNNRLFVANYEEDFFDIDDFATGGYWDARSYRFGSGGRSTLYDKDLTTSKYLTNTAPDWDLIPEDWDCINKKNSPKYELSTFAANDFFQTDLTTLGSDGKNVNITQDWDDREMFPDWSGVSFPWYSTRTNNFTTAQQEDGYASYANPKMSANRRSFKPDEVYRIGIQFKNSKQQFSYVKWICDYRAVYDDAADKLTSRSGIGRVKMKPIRLKFGVSNIPTDPETGQPFEFRITYVPLEDNDKSVFWGVFSPIKKMSTDDKYKITRLTESLAAGSNTGKYLDFVSSEYCIGLKKSYSHMKIFKVCTSAGIDTKEYKDKRFFSNKAYDFTEEVNQALSVTSQFDIEYSPDIDADIPLSGSDVLARNTPQKFYDSFGAINTGRANKGRSQIIYPSTPFGAETNDVYFGYCYSDIFESQYGGLSYESRKNSGYIPLTEFMNNTYEEVFGDSYLCNFEYLRLISENAGLTEDDNDKIGVPEILVFPTVSSLNLNLRSDDFFSKVYTQNGAYMMHEYAGVYEDTSNLNQEEYIFTQNNDLYLYNKTYSREQDLNKFYEKQSGLSQSDSFSNRIIASDKKIVGELDDSFLQISPGTYIDVDAQYGEIKRLIVFKDQLYFFQERAIGWVAVNQKTTTNSVESGTIVIGELGLLSRYDYITKEFGISDRTHIEVSEHGLYFVDTIKGEFLRISSRGLEQLSISSHINSLVKSIDLSAVSIVNNRKFNEILFLYRASGDTFGSQDALVFSEITNSFTSIFDINAEAYDSMPIGRSDLFDELLVEKKASGYESSIYSLNDGLFNDFNGSYYPSSITLIFSIGNEQNVLYNMIEFIGKQSTDWFIDTIRIYNDDYDTGTMNVADVMTEKFGTYRTSSLRGYVSHSNKERILTDHIYLHIETKDNASAQDRVYFRDFITSYTQYNYFG